MANRDNNDTTSRARATAPASSASSASSGAPPGGGTRRRWTAHAHLLTFAVTALVVWGAGTYALVYFFPRFWYSGVETEILSRGLGEAGSPGIPLNTLYTMPALASPSQSNSLESTGSHDTLYTVGLLDLRPGPQVLHVPDMAGRYYSVQFTDPWGTDFAYVGRRTTGTRASNYLISGPGWQGTVPPGLTQIVATDNTVLLIGRTLVTSDSDVAAAYGLAQQIRLTPLSQGPPGR